MLVAFGDAERAARRETAAGRHGERIGRRALDGGQPPRPGQMPVDARHRVDQRPGIGMARIGQHLLGRPFLHHLAGIHHDDARHTFAMTPSAWLMRMIAAPKSRLSSHDQVENLRLDGDVERGGRLVGDQQRGLVGKAHREHDALAHAAGELVRIGVDRALRRGDPHAAEQRDGAVVACSSLKRPCTRMVSTSWRAMRSTGLSDVIGSWNTIAMPSPRSARNSSAFIASTSRPWNAPRRRRCARAPRAAASAIAR